MWLLPTMNKAQGLAPSIENSSINSHVFQNHLTGFKTKEFECQARLTVWSAALV